MWSYGDGSRSSTRASTVSSRWISSSIRKTTLQPRIRSCNGSVRNRSASTPSRRPHPAAHLLLAAQPEEFLLSTIGGFSDRHGTEPEKEEGGLMQVQPPPAQAQKLDWYAQQVERVPGLPHTRPAYDEITKPVTAPINAACVDFRGQCKCYSQQGTELSTDEHLCRQIIAKGFFIDFDPRQSVTERTQQVERDRILADRQRSEEARQRMLDRQDELERRQQAPVQPEQQQPIQPSVIQRERMKESPWDFNSS